MIYAKRFVRGSSAVVTESTTLQQVSKALIKGKTSGVPVVDSEKRPIGFISERDIISAVAKKGVKNLTAAEIMQKKILTVEEDTPLEYVSKLFSEHSFANIAVTRGGKVVGMINRRDVISNLLGHYY